jgi:hypothetical protein
MLVVRALPGSATADYGQLGSWIDAGLRGCVARSQAEAGVIRD